MRTIKFKAKTLKTGEWAVGDLVCSNGKIFIKQEDEPNKVFPLCTKVDQNTVCEFTGFLDKNGKEIYEGDILRSDEYPFSCMEDGARDNYFGIIGWSDEEAMFLLTYVKNPKSSVFCIYNGTSNEITQQKLDDFEIVGDIHDPVWQRKLNLKDE